MNKVQYLYTQLAEESAEVAQECIKAVRFGHNSIEPGHHHQNKDRVMYEIADMLAVIELLEDEHAIDGKLAFARTLIDAKKEKIKNYMRLSREQGCLDDDAPDA